MQNETSVNTPANGDAANAGPAGAKPPTAGTHEDNARESRPAKEVDAADAADAALLKDLQKYKKEFLGYMTSRSSRKRPWLNGRKRGDPELLQVYCITYDHLDEAQRLLTKRAAAPTGDDERVRQQLRTLLGNDEAHEHADNIHAAWALAGSLEHMTLMLGDDSYLITRLENEEGREQKKLQGSWSEYLAVGTLEDLLKNYKQGDAAWPRARAVESLAYLYAKRHWYMGMLRACEDMKANYLNRLTLVLAVLLLLLFEVIYIADKGEHFSFMFRLDLANPKIQNALVAAMTGAVGGTLSGFYKLRDATGGIVTLRAFKWAIRAQPFVGATVGVLLMLFLMSGVVTAAAGATNAEQALSWLRLSVFCFIAGFSEPFFLGVVQRVAGAADKKAQEAAAGGAAGGAAGKTGDDKK